MSRSIGTIWNEWNSASFPGVEWWKRVNDESMDFLIHSPLSDIWSLMMSVVMSFLVETVDTSMSRWIRSVWNEWHGTSDSGVEWWERVNDETVNFFIHSPLSNIWLLSHETIDTGMSRWVRAVWNEWHSASNSGIKRWKGIGDETVDLLVHSSLGDIWFLVVSSLSEGSTLMSRCIRSVWYKWNSTSFPGIKRWKRVNNKSVNLLIHSSLCDVWSL